MMTSEDRDPTRMFRLDGKVALVTGGSRGLGRSMVLGLARAGADVVIASRKLASCQEVAAAVEALGRRALPIACHVAHWGELERLTNEAWDAFGKIDVLINNAGMSPIAPSSVETSEELWDKVLGVNLKGPFRLTALVGSRMAAGEGGSIINVSSVASIRPKPQTAPYGAAKAGLNALTVAFALEYGPKVRVNCLMAGPFVTDAARLWVHSDEFKQQAARSFALGRAGDPDEVVGTALYLASDASSFTTGAVLQVDGGSS
jgi:NAD(P)-dependent dehydrogenase (short-subunit alcohol dehydrogenase family)